MQTAVAHTMVAMHRQGKMYAVGGLIAKRKIILLSVHRGYPSIITIKFFGIWLIAGWVTI